MNDSEKKAPPKRRGRIFLFALCSAVLLGLLFGGGIFALTRHYAKTASSFSLADQGYSGNSFQKLLSLVQDNNAISETCERVQRSVVTLVVDVSYEGSYGQGLGSGVIFKEENNHLYILTNAHVVAEAQRIYLYTFAGDLAEMQLVGVDTESDLAVVSIDKTKLSEEVGSQLTIAELGDSDQLRSGQLAIAIGSPHELAYQNSVTVGVISYPKREIKLSETPGTYIQTDAAINPGNSGGPLFNEQGEVIGINSNKIALEDVEGIGFAIPINHAQEVVNALLKEGFVQYLTLGGIDDSSFLSESLAGLYHVPSGLVIHHIRSGSSAEKQGLRSGDIITEIDGQVLSSMEDVNEILLSCEVGDTVLVTVIQGRDASNPLSLELVLEPLDEDADPAGGFWGDNNSQPPTFR